MVIRQIYCYMAKRKQAWRDKYARSLGLQASERDEADEVIVVACRFCVAFGREPPPENTPRVGQRKSRKRSTNVAKWAKPFRPDNIRSHLVKQHTRKWGEYSELLRQLNNPEERVGAQRQLNAFFDQEEAPVQVVPVQAAEVPGSDEPTERLVRRKRRRHGQVEASEVAPAEFIATATDHQMPVAIAQPTTRLANSDYNEDTRGVEATGGEQPILLEEIMTPEIVETLVDGLYVEDHDDGRAGTKDLEMMKRVLQDQNDTVRNQQIQTMSNRTEKFVINVMNKEELASVQRLIGIGLTFTQTVKTLTSSKLRISATTVHSYARISTAVSLQMLSTVMRRSWICSIALHVLRCPKDTSCGGGERNPVLQLRVHLPWSRGTDVADLHVMALPLPNFERSPEQVLAFIEQVLNILDPEWRSKLLGGCVNGAANEMGTHSSLLLQNIMQQATSSSLYRIRRPAQVIDAYLRSALLGLSEGRYQELMASDILENGSFPQELARLAVFLRGYEPWTRVHGRCPQFDEECPWSTMNALVWILARRHHLQGVFEGHPYAQLPSPSFWLFASVLVDILSEFKEAVSNLERFPLPSRAESERILELCVNEFAKKSRISRNNGNGTVLDHGVCLEGDMFRVGQFCWSRRSGLIPYLRSLNLSMRRLYDGLPASDKHNVEWIVAGFILTCLGSVVGISESNLLEASSSTVSNGTIGSKTVMNDPPPTLPLDFVAIERMAAVDLIERYSDRLEQAYDLAFLDNISGDIEWLKARIADNPSLRFELEHAQSKSFRTAWDCVPDLNELRVFAAGLSTALPRTDSGSSIGLDDEAINAVAIALQQRTEDQYRVNLGDFSVEARLHMEQAHTLKELFSEQ
ncbi:hypothetical protein F441_04684 [Phytophthora nicotianae CJ01A1]|uniref:Uncharacterized protein n=5 Tax=Phytophthora nicotianae TaxID=4792 RepID=W2QIK6_PHYN3|nr:hypothetical protein PPTG_08984 [Phytophthora nicotianae INRA-310]ETK91957.1 hypothetical protein L915_04582 [Phytophthora nicotianae]ETP21896.1 hypothetical protein F441_04684 [Phytophthora nicotianae CJ01A1]ETP49786.1 hypothetical protein F442_04752 [Phytophthora nicotianae P10297]KUF64766.1 hypothetical protein AM587_10016418 [Phytophthora nicotianae]ETL45357.1 hypothetical protein L916_04536 [Phytophthora nicotianae]